MRTKKTKEPKQPLGINPKTLITALRYGATISWSRGEHTVSCRHMLVDLGTGTARPRLALRYESEDRGVEFTTLSFTQKSAAEFLKSLWPLIHQ